MNASGQAQVQEVIDVLLPTRNRPAALAVTLATLGAQSWPALRIVIADQSDGADACAAAEVQAVLRYLRATGRGVEAHRRPLRRGMAEQRAFLLAQAGARYCLFVDDDVILEPDLVARLHSTIRSEGCGFVGSALHGLSYLGERRPLQETIEFWDGPVTPEVVHPGTTAWTRHHLHSAANLFHVQSSLLEEGPDGRLSKQETRRYKVAWVGGCVMFDTAMLRAAGGFDFWAALPSQHCGEDVLAQQRVMARFGGCAIFPSGAYHMELPTTVTARAIDAPYVLPLAAQPASQPKSQPGSQAEPQPEPQLLESQLDSQPELQQTSCSAPQPAHDPAPPHGVVP